MTLRRTEFVGPQVGEELVQGGLMALAMVVLGIVIYLAMRFEWKFGLAAIIANLPSWPRCARRCQAWGMQTCRCKTLAPPAT